MWCDEMTMANSIRCQGVGDDGYYTLVVKGHKEREKGNYGRQSGGCAVGRMGSGHQQTESDHHQNVCKVSQQRHHLDSRVASPKIKPW